MKIKLGEINTQNVHGTKIYYKVKLKHMSAQC